MDLFHSFGRCWAQGHGDGGELVQVLVLMLIMAVSALGSILKSRRERGAPSRPKGPPRPSTIPRPVPPAGARRRAGPPAMKPEPDLGHATAVPVPRRSRVAPLPAIETETPVAAVALLARVRDRESLREAIVLNEILGPPRAVRPYEGYGASG